MTMFALPVGAVGEPWSAPLADLETAFVQMAGQVCNKKRTPLEYFGKLLIYAVRPGVPEAVAFPSLSPIEAISMFQDLLKHFYHASNSGRYEFHTLS